MRRPLFVSLASLSLAACSGGGPDQPRERVGTTGEALSTVCGAKSSGPVQGVDVSYYQGSFNWKGAGFAFGYARVSDGTGFIDPDFAPNWSNMKAAGVLRGAYMFFRPNEDEAAQADLMVQKVGGQLGDGDLPCMIDVEVTGGQSPSTIASKVQTWLDIVEKGTGRTPVIYTGPYFWQDNVKSTAFGKYPLWIADYGPSCPLIPNGWSQWTLWQYSDGGGNLDHDVFNGSLSELQGLAKPPDAAPRGYLDGADCAAIAGWAQDQDTPDQPIDVHLYFDGAAGSGAHAFATKADVHRNDLCKAIGSCDHGFTAAPPRSLLDGKKHDVYAYGIDTSGNAQNAQLKDAPKSLSCAPPAIGKMVRRWVTTPAAFSAWKLDSFLDVAHYADADFAAVPKGADMPAAPKVVQGDDGSPAIYVIDGDAKRHVVDPASMAAWRFDSAEVEKMAAATLDAMKSGPDWPRAPLGVQGSGAEVDVLDVAADASPLPPGSGGSPSGTSNGGGSAGGGGDGSGGWTGEDSGGCNAGGGSSGSAWAILFALGLVLRSRCQRYLST